MQTKNIISIDDLDNKSIENIFNNAREQIIKPLPRGHVVLSAFFEPSTRTRLSFELAASRLGCSTLTFDPMSSSLKKGESFAHTLLTLDSLGPDIIITRTNFELDNILLEQIKKIIINGGDATHEHPTQALLDCYTLLDIFKSDNLAGKNILIIGDIAHSRVAHSNIKLLKRLKAHLSWLGPKIFQDQAIEEGNSYYSFNNLDKHFDAIIVLRIQKERFMHVMSDEEYWQQWGLSMERFKAFGPQCYLLHPGPLNIGIEIADELFSHERSLIRSQVKNGVIIRAALMRFLLS
jgi:aspartate carbamoyltransferase catalytic subunit